MNMLALLVAMASAVSGQSCAAIDNSPNRAAFAVPGQTPVVRTYTDYGDNLGYNAYVPKPAWPATRAAEAALRHGKPGHKLEVACR